MKKRAASAFDSSTKPLQTTSERAMLAPMGATLEGIAGESCHELTMARHIIQAGRPFLKPLRYDGNQAVFPGFVLTGTTPETYIEVYGIHGNTTYDKRKATKKSGSCNL